MRAPPLPGCLLVNSGELLRMLTNDTWLATRHYAIPPASGSAKRRFSIPFFFNATADYKMAVVPSCCDESHPAKYPPTSYLDSQGVAQGE